MYQKVLFSIISAKLQVWGVLGLGITLKTKIF